MKVGDLAIVLPYKVKLRARWNNEIRSEDYIGQCGTVTEIMEELCGQPLIPPQVYVEFGDGFVGSYSLDKLEKYNPLSIDEDYYITPRKDKPRGFSQEEFDGDIAYLRKNLLEALKIPEEYLNMNCTECFYCRSIFSNDQFDDDYAVCGKCREGE
jgi:hypothetical protein